MVKCINCKHLIKRYSFKVIAPPHLSYWCEAHLCYFNPYKVGSAFSCKQYEMKTSKFPRAKRGGEAK